MAMVEEIACCGFRSSHDGLDSFINNSIETPAFLYEVEVDLL